METYVEIPYELGGVRLEYRPRPHSGYHQIDTLTLLWQGPECAASATLEIGGRAEDLRALAERIIALVDAGVVAR